MSSACEQSDGEQQRHADGDEDISPTDVQTSHNFALAPGMKGVTVSTNKLLTSMYRGVCWNRKNFRWQASLNNTGRYIYLGSYKTQEEAAAVFDKAALRLRGARARLNFDRAQYFDPATGQLTPDPDMDKVLAEAMNPDLKPPKRARALAGPQAAGSGAGNSGGGGGVGSASNLGGGGGSSHHTGAGGEGHTVDCGVGGRNPMPRLSLTGSPRNPPGFQQHGGLLAVPQHELQQLLTGGAASQLLPGQDMLAPAPGSQSMGNWADLKWDQPSGNMLGIDPQLVVMQNQQLLQQLQQRSQQQQQLLHQQTHPHQAGARMLPMMIMPPGAAGQSVSNVQPEHLLQTQHHSQEHQPEFAPYSLPQAKVMSPMRSDQNTPVQQNEPQRPTQQQQQQQQIILREEGGGKTMMLLMPPGMGQQQMLAPKRSSMGSGPPPLVMAASGAQQPQHGGQQTLLQRLMSWPAGAAETAAQHISVGSPVENAVTQQRQQEPLQVPMPTVFVMQQGSQPQMQQQHLQAGGEQIMPAVQTRPHQYDQQQKQQQKHLQHRRSQQEQQQQLLQHRHSQQEQQQLLQRRHSQQEQQQQKQQLQQRHSQQMESPRHRQQQQAAVPAAMPTKQVPPSGSMGNPDMVDVRGRPSFTDSGGTNSLLPTWTLPAGGITVPAWGAADMPAWASPSSITHSFAPTWTAGGTFNLPPGYDVVRISADGTSSVAKLMQEPAAAHAAVAAGGGSLARTAAASGWIGTGNVAMMQTAQPIIYQEQTQRDALERHPQAPEAEAEAAASERTASSGLTVPPAGEESTQEHQHHQQQMLAVMPPQYQPYQQQQQQRQQEASHALQQEGAGAPVSPSPQQQLQQELSQGIPKPSSGLATAMDSLHQQHIQRLQQQHQAREASQTPPPYMMALPASYYSQYHPQQQPQGKQQPVVFVMPQQTPQQIVHAMMPPRPVGPEALPVPVELHSQSTPASIQLATPPQDQYQQPMQHVHSIGPGQATQALTPRRSAAANVGQAHMPPLMTVPAARRMSDKGLPIGPGSATASTAVRRMSDLAAGLSAPLVELPVPPPRTSLDFTSPSGGPPAPPTHAAAPPAGRQSPALTPRAGPLPVLAVPAGGMSPTTSSDPAPVPADTGQPLVQQPKQQQQQQQQPAATSTGATVAAASGAGEGDTVQQAPNPAPALAAPVGSLVLMQVMPDGRLQQVLSPLRMSVVKQLLANQLQQLPPANPDQPVESRMLQTPGTIARPDPAATPVSIAVPQPTEVRAVAASPHTPARELLSTVQSTQRQQRQPQQQQQQQHSSQPLGQPQQLPTQQQQQQQQQWQQHSQPLPILSVAPETGVHRTGLVGTEQLGMPPGLVQGGYQPLLVSLPPRSRSLDGGKGGQLASPVHQQQLLASGSQLQPYQSHPPRHSSGQVDMGAFSGVTMMVPPGLPMGAPPDRSSRSGLPTDFMLRPVPGILVPAGAAQPQALPTPSMQVPSRRDVQGVLHAAGPVQQVPFAPASVGWQGGRGGSGVGAGGSPPSLPVPRSGGWIEELVGTGGGPKQVVGRSGGWQGGRGDSTAGGPSPHAAMRAISLPEGRGESPGVSRRPATSPQEAGRLVRQGPAPQDEPTQDEQRTGGSESPVVAQDGLRTLAAVALAMSDTGQDAGHAAPG